MKLQPIEKAPKDGTRIVIALYDVDRWWHAIGQWMHKAWTPYGSGHSFPATHWCPLPTLEDDDELQAVKAERDSMRAALIEVMNPYDDPGSYLAAYQRAKTALNPTPEESLVDGRAE